MVLPRPLTALVEGLDGGTVDLRDPAITALLTNVPGFVPAAGACRAGVSGALLRELLIALEEELGSRSTTIGFHDIVITDTLMLDDLLFERRLRFIACRFQGPVYARQLSCRSLTLDRSRFASSFDGRVMSLRGYLFLRGVRAMRTFLIRDTVAEGVIDCTGARFRLTPPAVARLLPGLDDDTAAKEAFGASRIQARALFWSKVRVADGVVGLLDAEVASLRDDMATAGLKSWPPKVKMRGFTYRIKNAAPLATHLAWLERDKANFEANGRMLVASLQNVNALDDAARLSIAIALRANRSVESHPAGGPRWVYLRLQSAAFHPEWVIGLLVLLYLLAVPLAASLYAAQLIEPIDGALLANKCYLATGGCPAEGWLRVEGHHYALPHGLPPFDKWEYALDLLFPYGPGTSAGIWGGANVVITLALLLLRTVALAFQAVLLWSLFGTRDGK